MKGKFDFSTVFYNVMSFVFSVALFVSPRVLHLPDYVALYFPIALGAALILKHSLIRSNLSPRILAWSTWFLKTTVNLAIYAYCIQGFSSLYVYTAKHSSPVIYEPYKSELILGFATIAILFIGGMDLIFETVTKPLVSKYILTIFILTKKEYRRDELTDLSWPLRGDVWSALMKLEKDGLISERKERDENCPCGKSFFYYKLTPRGLSLTRCMSA